MYAALFIESRDTISYISTGKLLDRFFERRVLLPNDLIEPRGSHSGVLHLLERPAGVYGLMLPRVADQHHAIMLIEPLQEIVNLFRTGEARLIDEIEMPLSITDTTPPAPGDAVACST
jgi:hypothetical protein